MFSNTNLYLLCSNYFKRHETFSSSINTACLLHECNIISSFTKEAKCQRKLRCLSYITSLKLGHWSKQFPSLMPVLLDPPLWNHKLLSWCVTIFVLKSENNALNKASKVLTFHATLSPILFFKFFLWTKEIVSIFTVNNY